MRHTAILRSLLLLAATQQPQPRPFRVPFLTVQGMMILVDASMNGQPAKLMLDTGSSYTTIDNHYGGPKLPATHVSQSGAGIWRETARVPLTLDIANITWTGEVAVMNLEDIQHFLPGLKVDGLLAPASSLRTRETLS